MSWVFSAVGLDEQKTHRIGLSAKNIWEKELSSKFEQANITTKHKASRRLDIMYTKIASVPTVPQVPYFANVRDTSHY